MKTALLTVVYSLALLILSAGCSEESARAPKADSLLLSGISLSGGILSPEFSPKIQKYSVVLPPTEATFQLTPSSTDQTVTLHVEPEGITPLIFGTNQFTVTVVSADNSATNTYIINVYRNSDETDLVSLIPNSGTLVPAFSPECTNYGLYLPSSTMTFGLQALPAAAGAAIIILPGNPIKIKEGLTNLLIRVRAEDGVSEKEYHLNVYRLGAAHISTNIGTLEYIPGGQFLRDANTSNISVISPFRMSRGEITRAQFMAVTGLTDPSQTGYSSGTTDPVQQVNWYHTLVFCNKLSLREGLTPVYSIGGSTNPDDWGAVPGNNNVTWNSALADWTADGYRLPTEMEWMWAAMGAQSGSDPAAININGYTKSYSGSTESSFIGDYVWYNLNSSSLSHPAISLLPNALGLHNMSGNVWEWCWDRNAKYPSGVLIDYRGSDVGTPRIIRGGAWGVDPLNCTISYRDSINANLSSFDIGFRVVRP